MEHFYKLDNHHTFITNKPMLVYCNTADMLEKACYQNILMYKVQKISIMDYLVRVEI